MKVQFLIVSVLALTITSGCSNKESSLNNTSGENETSNVETPNFETPPFIIDVHVHYRPTDEWEKSFLEVYSRRNSMACVMVPMENIDRGIKFAKANPDRVIPYARIHLNSPTVLEDIKKVHAMGYKGLGEVAPGNLWNYDDPRYDPIWSLAEELGMVVNLHTGIRQTGSFALLRPVYLATIAANHPNITVIGAHFGNPWYAEAGESARRNANLYFDLSGSSLIKMEDNPGIWKEYLWWTPHIGKAHMPSHMGPAFEKIFFASDEHPEALEENIRRFNKMLDACDVPEETRAKSYGITMAKIHGINVPAKKL